MSRSFIGFGQLKYIGVPFVRPITLEGRMGQVVPLMLNWLSYGASSNVPNINVAVDLSLNSVWVRLKQIRSIYIDNMGSDNPIYVYFPSTDYAVVAQPNSAGWFRAYSSDYRLEVIGEGFVTGDVPTTKILVANVDIAPAIDIEISQGIDLFRASATISRGTTIYNQNFGSPALGDQVTIPSVDCSILGTTANFGAFGSTGFVYLVGLFFDFTNMSGPFANVLFESTGIAGTLLNVGSKAQDAFKAFAPIQWKIDATQTWRLRVTAASTTGLCRCSCSFTTSPT